MTTDEFPPGLGLGLDHKAAAHWREFAACSDLTVAVHLIVDHEIKQDAIDSSPDMMHMQLHAQVVSYNPGEEGDDVDAG